jgi:hypothetical protein
LIQKFYFTRRTQRSSERGEKNQQHFVSVLQWLFLEILFHAAIAAPLKRRVRCEKKYRASVAVS